MKATWSYPPAPKTRLHKEGVGVNEIEPRAVLWERQLWLLPGHISKTAHSWFPLKYRPLRLQNCSGIHHSSTSKSGALTAGDAPSSWFMMAAATLEGTLQGDITPSLLDHRPLQDLMFWLEVTNLTFPPCSECSRWNFQTVTGFLSSSYHGGFFVGVEEMVAEYAEHWRMLLTEVQ